MVFAIYQHELIICIHVFPHPEAPTHLPPHPIPLLLQSCLTLCDPTDGSPPGSPVPGILQARTLEWVAISFSNAWKWKEKVKSLSRVRLFATSWTAAHQAPPSMGFSRQEYWSGVPFHPIPLGCPKTLVLGAMLHVLNSHWSSILHMVMHIFQCCSLKSFHHCLLPLSSKVCSLHLCLPCCPESRILGTMCLNSIYIYINMQYLSFSSWLTSLCIIDSSFFPRWCQ